MKYNKKEHEAYNRGYCDGYEAAITLLDFANSSEDDIKRAHENLIGIFKESGYTLDDTIKKLGGLLLK